MPMNSPSITTLTPGIAAAFFSSTEISFELKAGGRTTFPKKHPVTVQI